MNRVSSIRSSVVSKGIEALLLTDEVNIRYATAMDISDAWVLITAARAVLLTDFRYREAAELALGTEFEILTPSDKLACVTEALRAEAVGRLGFVGKSVSYKMHATLSQALEGVKLFDVEGLLDTLRMVKDSYEIESIATAQRIADTAFSELLKAMTPDMTEIEVAAELEYLMRRHGSEGPAFDTIAVSGDASAMPHGVPRNVKLKSGFLTLDFGAKVNGYCSDMTRTVVIGKADADLRKLYDTVLRAQLASLDYLEHSRNAMEADATARRIIDAEYPGAFGHSLGHGVGLLVHEPPSLSSRSAGVILVPGNVVTVEPGIYLPGQYGCRIEDMVLILDNGIRNFSASSKEMIEIF